LLWNLLIEEGAVYVSVLRVGPVDVDLLLLQQANHLKEIFLPYCYVQRLQKNHVRIFRNLPDTAQEGEVCTSSCSGVGPSNTSAESWESSPGENDNLRLIFSSSRRAKKERDI
jgi:hypothetical protein